MTGRDPPPWPGRYRYGFVEFVDRQSAVNALQYNGHQLGAGPGALLAHLEWGHLQSRRLGLAEFPPEVSQTCSWHGRAAPIVLTPSPLPRVGQ